jgi:hypothetical protein
MAGRFGPVVPTPPLSSENKKDLKALQRAKKAASTQGASPSASTKRQEEQLAVLKRNLTRDKTRLRTLNDTLAKPPIRRVVGLLEYNLYYIPWQPPEGKPLATRPEAEKIKADLTTAITNTQENIRLIERALGQVTQSQKNKKQKEDEQRRQDAATAPPTTTPKRSPVEYNVSAVKEAYYLPNMSFFNQVDEAWSGKGATNAFDAADLYAKNTPAKVNAAKKLWEEALASKGMLQTYIPPGKKKQVFHDGNGNLTEFEGQKSLKRYGFQFIYNPETVQMSYGGVPPVDPNREAAGKEEYNLMAPSLSSSSISFSLLLNRMFDLKYIGPGGTLNSDMPIEKLWPSNAPDAKTLKAIYEKGTMYDVEFLLRTLFSIDSFPSQFRGDTTDIGYLGAMQVELHLGKKLRYLVIIESIDVHHAMFNRDMVPMMSTIKILAKRIPDYRGNKIVDGA